MSDKRVKAAINDSILSHQREIGRLLMQQSHVKDMMLQPGTTSHALWSLTNTYSLADEKIGQARTSIRNLKEQYDKI